MDEKKKLTLHDEAVLITNFLKSEGGQALMDRLQRQKKSLEDRLLRGEIDIEVGGIDKKDDNVTIVILNKDQNKIKLALHNALIGEFKMLEEEAAKPAGGHNE